MNGQLKQADRALRRNGINVLMGSGKGMIWKL